MRKIILAGTSLSLAVALSHCVGDSTATGNDADSGSGTDGSTQQGADSGGQNGMDGSMNSADTGVDAGPLVTGRFISDYIIPDATPGSIGYIANVAVSSTDIILTGFFTGTMNINGLGYVAAGTSRDVFVVDLALSNYGVKWVKTYGTADDDWANGVAIDPSGNIYVSGYVNGATNNAAGNVAFGAKSLLLKHVDAHSFVLKLDSAGVAQWVVGFDATTANGGYRTDCTTLAISKTGNIGVGCSTGGTLAFATGAASTDTRTYGGGQTNVWLAELEPTNGYVTWGALLNGNNPDGVAQVAYDSQNALYAVGTTSSTTLATVDAPAFTITKAVGGSGAGWIAKLNAGAPRTLGFTQTWGGATTVSAVSVAIDPKDRPYVAGGFSSTINFGGAAAMIAAGTMDSYLLALNPSTGATIAQTQIGASANAFNATAIASDDLGNIAVAGYYAGTGFTLAGTALPASAGPDTSSVIAKYPPALATPIYAQPSIAEPEDSGNGSGLHLLRMVTHAGETFAVGTISGNGDLGDGKRSTHTLGGTTFLIRRAR